MKSNITGKVSVSINADASEVWNALTKPEIIKQYFFGTIAESDWQEGSPVIFKGEWQGKSYLDKGIVLNVEPCKLLRYSYWSSLSGLPDKLENYVPITYALSEGNGKTTLTVTQENIPDEKMKVHSEKNWKTVLTNLKKLLEKHIVSYA